MTPLVIMYNFKNCKDSVARWLFSIISLPFIWNKKKYRKAIVLLEPYLKSTILDTLQKKKLELLTIWFAYYKDNQVLKGLALMNQAFSNPN
jgi:hypothetical protein